MLKTAEEALSKIFFVGFKEANMDFKNASYSFIKRTLTEMASKVSSEDIFERNLER